MCVCVISCKPWPVRVRVRVTQGLSLSNSPGVIETNGLSLNSHGGHLDPQRGHWCSVRSFRPTPDYNCYQEGFIRPTDKLLGHSPCATLPDHVTMSRLKRFTREQVLQQLFSQQPSSEPEEDAKEPDREADGQGDGGLEFL